jgi:hypothetical protein
MIKSARQGKLEEFFSLIYAVVSLLAFDFILRHNQPYDSESYKYFAGLMASPNKSLTEFQHEVSMALIVRLKLQRKVQNLTRFRALRPMLD